MLILHKITYPLIFFYHTGGLVNPMAGIFQEVISKKKISVRLA